MYSAIKLNNGGIPACDGEIKEIVVDYTWRKYWKSNTYRSYF